VFDSTKILYSVPYSIVTHEQLMSFLPGSDWYNSDDVITGVISDLASEYVK
jgi:hypothetical protein